MVKTSSSVMPPLSEAKGLIPESSAYEALDPNSTLVATGNNWVIARKLFSALTVPEFTRGVLEASIANWLTSCKQ
jgi:hypothetical protein